MEQPCLQIEDFIVNTKVNIYINDIQNIDNREYINKTIRNKYVDDIYNGIYFIEIVKTSHANQGIIDINGNVSIEVIVHGRGVNICEGSNLKIEITQKNKMGYSYVYNKICIYIPIVPEYCNNKEYFVGDVVNVLILGKRVEDKIVCVAKII